MSDIDQAAHATLNRRSLRPSRLVVVFRLHEYLAAVVRLVAQLKGAQALSIIYWQSARSYG